MESIIGTTRFNYEPIFDDFKEQIKYGYNELL